MGIPIIFLKSSCFSLLFLQRIISIKYLVWSIVIADKDSEETANVAADGLTKVVSLFAVLRESLEEDAADVSGLTNEHEEVLLNVGEELVKGAVVGAVNETELGNIFNRLVDAWLNTSKDLHEIGDDFNDNVETEGLLENGVEELENFSFGIGVQTVCVDLRVRLVERLLEPDESSAKALNNLINNESGGGQFLILSGLEGLGGSGDHCSERNGQE